MINTNALNVARWITKTSPDSILVYAVLVAQWLGSRLPKRSHPHPYHHTSDGSYRLRVVPYIIQPVTTMNTSLPLIR